MIGKGRGRREGGKMGGFRGNEIPLEGGFKRAALPPHTYTHTQTHSRCVPIAVKWFVQLGCVPVHRLQTLSERGVGASHTGLWHASVYAEIPVYLYAALCDVFPAYDVFSVYIVVSVCCCLCVLCYQYMLSSLCTSMYSTLSEKRHRSCHSGNTLSKGCAL